MNADPGADLSAYQTFGFIEPFGAAGAKPAGAAFYPPDLTKEEFERYVAAHPEQKDALQGLFTVVRRDGANLVAIPYSRHYAGQLEVAVGRLREASALTTNASLRNYLDKLIVALRSDEYRESDMAWMDLNGPIEVVIGPYEVYEDELFNFKAAYESFIATHAPLRDRAGSGEVGSAEALVARARLIDAQQSRLHRREPFGWP